MARRSSFGYKFEPMEGQGQFTNIGEEVFSTSRADESMSPQHGRPSMAHSSGEDLLPPTTTEALRETLANTQLAKYLRDFDAEADQDSLVFCSLPATVVDDNARAQTLAAGIEKEDDAMQHKNSLIQIERLRRSRLMELEQARQERKQGHEQNLRNVQLMKQQTTELVSTYYDHAQRELAIHLASREGEVSQSVGEVRQFGRGDYDPDKPLWEEFEQQVQIEVVRVRGVKNKVPKGRYVVLVSKWEKLAGQPLRWSTRHAMDKPPPPCPMHAECKDHAVRRSCEVCQGWAGCTPIIEHSGDATALSIDFASKTFTFFQAQTRIKPYNVLMFELVRLPDESKLLNRAFFTDPNAGRPKVVGWGVIPIVDSRFQVINGKFRFPMLRGPYKPTFGHFMTVQRSVVDDLENWLGNIYIDIFPHPRTHFGRSEFQLQTDFANKLLSLTKYPSAVDPEGWPYDERRRGASIDETANQEATLEGLSGFKIEDEEQFPYQRPARVKPMDTVALTRWNVIRTAIFERQRQRRIQARDKQQEAIRRVELQKTFRYSIHPYGATQLQSLWRTQVEYCMRAIVDELWGGVRSGKTWLSLVIFIVALYFQLYVHGLTLYLALRVNGTPVQGVYPKWFGVKVEYSHLQTTQLQELFTVFLSQFSNWFFVLAEIGVAGALYASIANVPVQLSKFIFTTALSAMLVPWFELLFDLTLDLRRSDYFRLHEFFSTHNYGPHYTWSAYLLIFIMFLVCSVVAVFLYTMALHLNGILQDAYWRIMIVNEDTCHIPNDLEISTRELTHILSRAERWRGKNGERRKVMVRRLITTDESDPEYRSEDLHISVMELKCNTAEEWVELRDQRKYREFAVMADGAILEILEGASPQGVSFALNEVAQKLNVAQVGADMDFATAAKSAFGASMLGLGGFAGANPKGRPSSSSGGSVSRGSHDDARALIPNQNQQGQGRGRGGFFEQEEPDLDLTHRSRRSSIAR